MTRHRRCSIVASAIVLLLPMWVACSTPQATPIPPVTSTSVPTPTAPPTNTPQPEPTPTELPADVEEEALVVLQHTSYTDGGGNLHVVGQVYNNTGSNLRGVQVKGLFYDGDEQLLAEKVTFAHAEILPPLHRAPFALTLFDPAQAPETYALEVNGKETDDAPFQALELVQHALRNNDKGILVLGEIHNANEQPASKVRVAATLYDAAGQIIGVAFTFLQREVLEPGAIVPFEIRTRAANGTPDHYRVIAYGDRATEAELDRQATPEILSTRHYRDDYNGLVIVGEMLNTEDTHVTFAKALVSFYDPNGQLIAARWSYAWAKILEPQGRSPFRVRLIEPLDGPVTWAVQVEGERTEDAPQGQLVLEDKENAIDAEDVSTFAGTVRNAGSEAMEAIEIAATVYDATGNVAAVGWVSLESALAPGESVPFELQVQVTQDAQGFGLAVQGKATQ